MSDFIVVEGEIVIETSDIYDIKGLKYEGKESEYLNDKYIVRVFSKTPFINLVCNSLPEAKELYRDIMKSRNVIDINEMRFGK